MLLGFCWFLFFFGLGYFGLIGADEPRYAQVAREMLERHDWITPTLGGRPWLEKPVLYYWQAMAAYRIFGVSDWAARLPSAFDATLMVVAVYIFLRRFRAGSELDGALITAASAGVIGFAHAASTDMPLAATLTIGLLAWFASYITKSRLYLAAFYAFVALATLAKGPVAPFLAAVAVGIFVLVRREYEIIGETLWIPGILVYCAVALPWYVAVQIRNPQFMRVFILEHNLARFGSNLFHHPEPFWYYLPVTALAFLPWTIFVIAALAGVVRQWREKTVDAFEQFLLIWMLVPMVFFSTSQSKLPGYVLPAVPAGALLVSEYVRRKVQQAQSSEAKPKLWLASLHAIAAAGLIVPALTLPYIVTEHHIIWGEAAGIAIGLALVVAVAMVMTLMSRAGLRLLRPMTLLAVVIIIAAVLRVGAPALNRTLSARPVAEEIERLQEGSLNVAVFRVPRETEYGLGFYCNRAISNYDAGQIPAGEHVVVTRQGSAAALEKRVHGRRVSYLAAYPPQKLDYFLISGAGQ